MKDPNAPDELTVNWAQVNDALYKMPLKAIQMLKASLEEKPIEVDKSEERISFELQIVKYLLPCQKKGLLDIIDSELRHRERRERFGMRNIIAFYSKRW
ncbi:MAG: hypothetical protein WC471_03120 [Candidatus Woesearchaeota archaeon]